MSRPLSPAETPLSPGGGPAELPPTGAGSRGRSPAATSRELGPPRRRLSLSQNQRTNEERSKESPKHNRKRSIGPKGYPVRRGSPSASCPATAAPRDREGAAQPQGPAGRGDRAARILPSGPDGIHAAPGRSARGWPHTGERRSGEWAGTYGRGRRGRGRSKPLRRCPGVAGFKSRRAGPGQWPGGGGQGRGPAGGGEGPGPPAAAPPPRVWRKPGAGLKEPASYRRPGLVAAANGSPVPAAAPGPARPAPSRPTPPRHVAEPQAHDALLGHRYPQPDGGELQEVRRHGRGGGAGRAPRAIPPGTRAPRRRRRCTAARPRGRRRLPHAPRRLAVPARCRRGLLQRRAGQRGRAARLPRGDAGRRGSGRRLVRARRRPPLLQQ